MPIQNKSIQKKVRQIIVVVIVFAGGVWLSDRMMTSKSKAQEAEPATQPTSRPTLTADVKPLVDRLTSIYSQFPLRLQSTMTSSFDVAGVVENKSFTITTSARSADVYRHDVKDQLTVVADGKSVQLFDAVHASFAAAPVGAKSRDADSWRRRHTM